MIHDFNERLAFSEKAGHEEFWAAIYQKAFPDMIACVLCTGKCQGQYLGIDRLIQLKSGKTLYIDEKKREANYDDFLLEYISVDTTNAPGWMEKDLLIDFIAYAFMPTKRCYLLPWQQLRRAWKTNKASWIARYPRKEAQNRDYKTIGVAVPIGVVLNEVRNACLVQL